MLDESVERNENPEKIKFLFFRIIVFQFALAPLNIASKYCTEHFYSQVNYEFIFIPTLETGKTGVDLTIIDKKIE